ncbi:MAG: FecR family protein [Marinifilaceae bacterium]|jgi:ferric-dicitrate binding protein FerR (iron transport regulator)|nr:FecR family protein [Marinifilaceae bacterium]
MKYEQNIDWEKIAAYHMGEMSEEDRSKFLKSTSDDKNYQNILQANKLNHNTKYNTDARWEDTKLLILKKNKSRKLLVLSSKIAAVFLCLLLSYFIFLDIKNQNTLQYVNNGNKPINIVLTDSSSVLLNVNSSLKLSENFNEKSRNVSLVGEAFFDIKRNEKLEFVITTRLSKIRVLGTSFNVRENEKNTEVFVNSGLVSFSQINNPHAKVNISKKQFARNDSSGIKSAKLINENYMSWKSRKFNFKNQSLENIIKHISNVYNYNYIFRNKNHQSIILTTSFENKEIDFILNTISRAADIEIVIESDTIIIN